MDAVNLNQIMVNVLLGIISAFGAVVVPFFLRWLRAKVLSSKSDMLRNVYNQLEGVVTNVVNETQQTLVDEIKAKSADGTLTKADAIAIKQAAIDKVKQVASANTLKLIGSEGHNVDAVISTLIEASVRRLKLDEGTFSDDIIAPSIANANVAAPVAAPAAPVAPVAAPAALVVPAADTTGK